MTASQTLPPTRSIAPQPHSRARLAGFAWGVLAYNIAVILWGTVVRATGSGAGCGDHWPLCNGTLMQAHPRMATIIELVHRMTSGVTVIAVLVLVLLTFRATLKRHLARFAAAAAAVLTFNEALLGALLVLLHLTAQNHSPTRGVYLSLHLANTLLLLAALALCAHFLQGTRDCLRGAVRFVHLPLAILGLLATIAVGVTGSLAALGDTLFPPSSLRAAFSQDLSAHSGWLIHLRVIHPLSALIAGFFICWLIFQAVYREHSSTNRGLALAVVLLLGLQFGLGVADVLLLAPLGMQVAHLLGADLLWTSLVVLAARICVQ